MANRVGWNARGGSTGYWARVALEESARANADGYYWQNETQNIKLALIERMGQEQFEAWAESVFPGDTIDQVTWETIAREFGAKLVDVLSEGISKSWMDDPEHYKMES